MGRKKLSRRQFLKGALAVALFAGTGAVYGAHRFMNRDGHGNLAYKMFPYTLPGARKIAGYEASNSKYCLVHVRQEHLTGNKEVDETSFDEIKLIQTDIYT